MIAIFIVILLIIGLALIYNFYDNFNTSINGKLLSRINHKLKSVSNNKIIKVKGLETKLIPATIDLRTNLDLDFITRTIISKLNCAEFNFIKTSYDRVIKIQNKNQIQYKYDAFISEMNHVMTFKFKINVVIDYIKDPAKKYLTATEVTNYPFKTYPIGIPKKDQLVPLPTEVIPTGNIVLGTTSVDPIIKHNMSNIYINYIMIENSTMVYNPEEITRKTAGVNDTTLDSSIIETFQSSPNDRKLRMAKYRNPWSKLPGQNKNKHNWPCKPKSFSWDSLGVIPNNKMVKPTKDCPGASWWRSPPLNEFQAWPIFNKATAHSGEYYNLFDLSNGVPQTGFSGQ